MDNPKVLVEVSHGQQFSQKMFTIVGYVNDMKYGNFSSGTEKTLH